MFGKFATPRYRLSQLPRRLLPRTWVLHAKLRGIDRDYGRLIARATGKECEHLVREHWTIRNLEAAEVLESIQTSRLCDRARRYYIAVPEIHWQGDDLGEENWVRGRETGAWSLKPAAVASLQRQIEEARKRRLEIWEARAKILGGLITGLVALVSALVSLVRALGR